MIDTDEWFSLGALSTIQTLDRAIFVPRSLEEGRVMALVWTMAMVFNDLRGFYYWYTVLAAEERRYEGNDTAIKNIGFSKNQVAKYMIAHGQEAIQLLKRHKGDLLAHSSLQGVRGQLGEKASEAWGALEKLFSGEETDDIHEIFPGVTCKSLREFIFAVRSKTAFHFDDMATMSSGMAVLVGEGPMEMAYGLTMESTRFFFADEASSHFIYQKAKEHGIVDVGFVAVNLTKLIHRAFASFVARFIEQRQKELGIEGDT